MFHLTLKSANAKTGPIPVSTSTAKTCPTACPFKKSGCYADGGPLAMHWAQVTKGTRGASFKSFCADIAQLPDGQLWRHNQAGDLPGAGNAIDTAALKRLVDANKGKRGFTYTHKPMASAKARKAIQSANKSGFTINLSANTLQHADQLADLAIAPVVVVLEHAKATVTPAGRKVIPCPAQTRDDVTCASCALCASRNPSRPIIGFAAHGSGARKVIHIMKGN